MWSLIIILIIVGIKGIFSAAETAFTHLSKSKIHQMSKKDEKAKRVYGMLENKHKFFGLAEVGIVVCELLASAVAAETFVHDLAIWFVSLGLIAFWANVFSILIITLILSYFLLVFGAMLPKRLAIIRPEQTMFRLINVLYILSYANYPFEKIATFSTGVICKIFNVSEEVKEPVTDKEIKLIIAEGKEQGVIDKFEKDILTNVLKYNSVAVKDIMIPKEKVDFINVKSDLDTILENIKKNLYTRIPVYEGNRDNILGLLYIKDIAADYADDKKIKLDIEKYIRPVTFIDGAEKIMQAFKTMQLNNQQMLIVVNDERKVTGIITMEDIIEVLMGKILDEDDKN